ncbi:MAG: NAD(P)H-binding protein [Planctomycetota bacterium]|nr:NAD(P)H-binding protein [Planctomycetota bacterium]
MSETVREPTPPTLALVVGRTGKTGRRVAEQLEARGVPTRAVSRSSEIPFDWDDRSNWDAVLEGVSAAYVTYSPDLAVPEAPPAITAFTALAKKHGVERLVLLSGRGEEEAQRCERIALDTNPDWTVVRAGWFNQNFSESFLLDPLRSGTLALPAGDIGEPFIDVDDIADVVVAAMTETGHEGEIYEVTGPRLLTFAQAVEELAGATGRPLRYEQVPVEDFVTGMRAHGTPEVIIGLTRYLFETVLDGRNAYVTDGVQRALGRPARDFADYTRAAAATGIWDAPVIDEVGAS